MPTFNVHEWNRKRRLSEDNALEDEKEMVLQDIVDYATTNYLNRYSNTDALTRDMLDGIIDYCQQLKASDY